MNYHFSFENYLFLQKYLLLLLKKTKHNINVKTLCLSGQLLKSALQCLHFLASILISSLHFGHFLVCSSIIFFISLSRTRSVFYTKSPPQAMTEAIHAGFPIWRIKQSHDGFFMLDTSSFTMPLIKIKV